MKLDAYLARIGLAERPAPTLDGLRVVHRAHLLSIPYENFDVQFGRPLTTDPAAAFDKIVTRRRGGWCYEMNGLLGWALGELGFRVTRSCGAVKREIVGDAMIGNHLVLRVDLPEGTWLADAGFGDGPIDPIRVAEGDYEANGGFAYRVMRVDETWWRLKNPPFDGTSSFDFTLLPADEAQLSERCVFLQNAPVSPFVQNAVAQRWVPGCIHILRGRTLRDVRPDGFDERVIADADDLVTTLSRDFGLELPEAAELWPKIVARHDVVMAERAAAETASA